ncbi:MAG: hypothetical protein AAFU85_20410 [Planctomycetota bacterium]
MSKTYRLAMTGAFVLMAGLGTVAGQDTPMARMRPIGTPSAVDQYRGQSSRGSALNRPRTMPTPRNETAFWQPNAPNQSVVQTAMMQSDLEAPSLPGETPGEFGLPPGDPAAGSSIPSNPPFPSNIGDRSAETTPRTLPPSRNPAFGAAPGSPALGSAALGSAALGGGANAGVPGSTFPRTVPSSPSDLTPIPQPRLNSNGFSTVDNCRLISGPSTYTAAMAYGCGNQQIVPTGYGGPSTVGGPVTSPFAGVPAEYAPAATLPPTTIVAPTGPFASRGAAPARSLFTLGQETNTVQVGQGLWGQPKAYVPGQNVRNWVRYFFP